MDLAQNTANAITGRMRGSSASGKIEEASAKGEVPEGSTPETEAHSIGAASTSSHSEAARQDPPPFDFQLFLDQMKSRSAEPVAKYLRS